MQNDLLVTLLGFISLIYSIEKALLWVLCPGTHIKVTLSHLVSSLSIPRSSDALQKFVNLKKK